MKCSSTFSSVVRRNQKYSTVSQTAKYLFITDINCSVNVVVCVRFFFFSYLILQQAYTFE